MMQNPAHLLKASSSLDPQLSALRLPESELLVTRLPSLSQSMQRQERERMMMMMMMMMMLMMLLLLLLLGPALTPSRSLDRRSIAPQLPEST